jgi:tRNA threonylcarbamoyladenosine biosynthesis protein TsaE
MQLSEPELRRWGGAIGKAVGLPVFIGLRGELGAGKSVLARAIARGAGVAGNLPSPTFNLLFRYPADRDGHPIYVVHMYLYRLATAEEVWELGWEEHLSEDQIVLVEWPERAERYLPEDRWEVELRTVRGDPHLRKVEVTRIGHPPALPTFPLSLDAGGGG